MDFISLDLNIFEKAEIYNYCLDNGNTDIKYICNEIGQNALLYLKSNVIRHSKNNKIDYKLYESIKNTFCSCISCQNFVCNIDDNYPKIKIEIFKQNFDIEANAVPVFQLSIDKSWIRDEIIQAQNLWTGYKELVDDIKSFTLLFNSSNSEPINYTFIESFYNYVYLNNYESLILSCYIKLKDGKDAELLAKIYVLNYLYEKGVCKKEISKFFDTLKSTSFLFLEAIITQVKIDRENNQIVMYTSDSEIFIFSFVKFKLMKCKFI